MTGINGHQPEIAADLAGDPVDPWDLDRLADLPEAPPDVVDEPGAPDPAGPAGAGGGVRRRRR